MSLLKPVESLYQAGAFIKNIFYDWGVLPQVEVPVPVISIGNLSFGGAGKTPFTIWLASELSRSKRVAVICRSYKTKLTQPQKVEPSESGAALIYGDEACLLQKELPQCRVWAGPQKFKTAQAAMIDQPEVILVDDGFSHRQLMRKLDIVLIDAASQLHEYKRESLGALKRAQLVILTKTHLVQPYVVDEIKALLTRAVPALENKILISRTEFSVDVSPSEPVFAFCGLAKPDSFWSDLRLQNLKIIEKKAFQDHQDYSDVLQKKIFARYLDLKNEYRQLKIVTTAKDAVKLTNADLVKSLHVARHKFVLSSADKEAIFEKIRPLF